MRWRSLPTSTASAWTSSGPLDAKPIFMKRTSDAETPNIHKRIDRRVKEGGCAERHCSGSQAGALARSEENTSELQSLMRHSYAVLCLKKTRTQTTQHRKTRKHT